QEQMSNLSHSCCARLHSIAYQRVELEHIPKPRECVMTSCEVRNEIPFTACAEVHSRVKAAKGIGLHSVICDVPPDGALSHRRVDGRYEGVLTKAAEVA